MNRKIIDYTTISIESYTPRSIDMSDMVKDLLKKGWEPFGGISITSYLDYNDITGRGNRSKVVCTQAMVKYEDMQN